MVLHLVLFLALLVAIGIRSYDNQRTRSDPDWEARWSQLPQIQREQIASAVRRGEPLQDPEEAELGAALARQRRKASAQFSNHWLIHLVLVGFLLLIVLIGGSPLLILPVLLLLTFLIWVAYRERATERNLKRAEAAAAESRGSPHSP
jgi:Flp pilus assembly protein TadB